MQKVERRLQPWDYAVTKPAKTLSEEAVFHEMQLSTGFQLRHRGTNPKRAAPWVFGKLETVRNRTIRQAGRLNRPTGVLTLMLNRNEAVQKDYERIMREL